MKRDPNLQPAAAPSRDIDDEALAAIVGAAALSDPDHPAWSDPRFVDWIAEEARDAARRKEAGAPAVQRGDALHVRGLARRSRVQRRTLSPAPVCTPSGRTAPLVELGVAAGVGRELWDEPAEQWVSIPDDLPPGEYVAFRIVGDSMTPLIHTGDVVLVRIGRALSLNSVVVARHPDDGYLCKRVRGIGQHAVKLESLQPGRPDITIPRRADLIVGTVRLVSCTHGDRATGMRR